MGGYGSGYRPLSKLVVEQCISLDVNRLARRRMLRPDSDGRIELEDPSTGQRVGSARCMLGPDLGDHMYLTVRLGRGWGQEEEGMEYVVELQPSEPHFGGRRWWFLCPFCCERKGKLYLRLKGLACRRCGDLTYTSCKEAHQGDRGLLQAMRLHDYLGCSGSD